MERGLGRAILDRKNSMVSKNMVCLRIKRRHYEGKAWVKTGWGKDLRRSGGARGKGPSFYRWGKEIINWGQMQPEPSDTQLPLARMNNGKWNQLPVLFQSHSFPQGRPTPVILWSSHMPRNWVILGKGQKRDCLRTSVLPKWPSPLACRWRGTHDRFSSSLVVL